MANNRDTGIYLKTTKNLELDTVTASGNRTVGVSLSKPTLATDSYVKLKDLTLTNNGTAFALGNVDATSVPFTIDGSLFTSLAGSLSALNFDAGSVKGVTVGPAAASPRWALPTLSTAISANQSLNTSLTFRNLGVSGLVPMGSASGIFLAGASNTISNVLANHSDYGVRVEQSGAGGLSIDSLTADGSGSYGLYLVATGTPALLENLTLTNSNTGFYAQNSGGITLDAASNLVTTGDFDSIRLFVSSNVTLTGLTLPGYSNGVEAQQASNTNLIMTGLDVSSPVPGGNGIFLGGPSNTLTTITARHRNYGVRLEQSGASAVSINGLDADGSDQGLYGSSGGTPTLFKNLTLTNTYRAFYMTGMRGPLTLDATSAINTAGSFYSMYLDNGPSDITLSGLGLHGFTYGLWAQHQAGRRLVIQNVEASRAPAGASLQCGGGGIALGGSDHTVTGISVAGRDTGLSFDIGDRNTVTGSVLGANTTGLSVTGSTLIPNTTVATGTSTTTAIRVASVGNISVGMTLRVFLPGGAEDRVVSAIASPVVTFSTALSTIPVVGVVVQGLGYGNARVTLTKSDICANRTAGMAAGTNVMTTTNNVACARVEGEGRLPLAIADCPIAVDGDTIEINGRLVEGGLEVSYEARAVDPSGNFAVVPCSVTHEPDRDADGIVDSQDNCVDTANNAQVDGDQDGIGDACDVCPAVADPDQGDGKGDGVGDACSDADQDGILDRDDNCALAPNPDQVDSDDDGEGDACDPEGGIGFLVEGGCAGGNGGLLAGLVALLGLRLARRRGGARAP